MSARSTDDSLHAVTPHLVCAGAAAIDFDVRAFEAEARMRLPDPDGTIPHASLRIGDPVLSQPMGRHSSDQSAG